MTGRFSSAVSSLQSDAAALQLRLEGGPAVDDVLVPTLPLEPLAYLGAGVAGAGDLHPVPAWAVGGLGGDHLYDVAVFQAGIKGDQTAVDLGPHHVVAHGGVDVIGEVDGRGSGGEVDDVAAGGEHEHLVGKHIHLQGVDEVLGVGALLVLQQPADPLIAALVPGPADRSAYTSSGRRCRIRPPRASHGCGSAPRRGCRSGPPRWCGGSGTYWAWGCRYSP